MWTPQATDDREKEPVPKSGMLPWTSEASPQGSRHIGDVWGR